MAEKGYNLILIERSIQPLNDIQNAIKNKNLEVDVITIELNKFDEDTLNKALYKTKDLPIKLFINCKNSKRKALKSLE